MKLSSGKMQNFWSWYCSPQVLDDQNIWIIGSLVNGILLYITKMILWNLQKCTTYNIDKPTFHTNLKHHTTNNEFIIMISKNTDSYHKNLCHNLARQKSLCKKIFSYPESHIVPWNCFSHAWDLSFDWQIVIEWVLPFLLFKVQTHTNTGD